MNDDFLYDLRNNPPSEFATRLKAQLERQTVETQRRQRAFRWASIAAVLVGSTALALVSPTVRQTALTMIVHVRGGESTPPLDSELQRLIEQKDARAEQRIMPQALFEQDRPPSEMEWSAASGRAAPDAATFATRPDSGSVVTPPSAKESTTLVGGRGPTVLRMGHSPSLTGMAERLASTLERGNPNLDVALTKLSDSPGVCTRGKDGANQDVWIHDRDGPASVPCEGGRDRFIRVPFAFDAIVLVVHRENSWARAVTIDDLRKLRDRGPTDPLLVWSQLRSEWPTLPISLAGTSLRDSEVGRRFVTSVGLSTNPLPSIFVSMQDDRATLKYVENTLGAIGYVDYATWDAVLRERSAYPAVVAITGEQGEPILPGVATIQERRYPLSRPLWLYVEEQRSLRPGQWTSSIGPLMRPRTIEESGLIPVGSVEQREASRLLRGF